MVETLIGKPYGLTPDEQLKAHQILTASTAIKRTPYMLDLGTMDRKPDIVPKVGDNVKIKSRAWYEKWCDKDGNIRFTETSCAFVKGMKDLCGRVFTINRVVNYDDGKRWLLDNDHHYWVPEFFEEVYPMLEQIKSPFPKIDFNSKADFVESPLTVPHFPLKAGELIVAKTEIGSMIEDTAKRLAAYTSVQGLTAKPELKQVKITRLIKLKKL